ncbi:sulfurtransferase [Glaciihabitans sp. dw_435]|uniref:sulfurtransferase n=1 Tax=Glaciihabitans sp. dw_435 TaxID=2720081 RepID=UPI001BD4E8B4|nr:rhodanese-like domain-containing protein [Glaciihabitans sp. dw_435]
MSPALSSPVVSTQWLADYLGSDELVVVDASVSRYIQPNGLGAYLSGHEQYILTGHIPGAVFADVIDDFSDPDAPFPFTHPTAERFAAAAGALGITNSTTVVVYDSAVGQWAARLWWLFRAFGYDRVAVLDGGLTKWKQEERETEIGHVEPVTARFEASERPELWVDKAYVEAVVAGDIEAALVCAAPQDEFTGAVVTRVRGGHIPGSISAPAASLVEDDSHALLSDAALRSVLAPALGAPRIVVYCGGGIAATAAALALTLLGETSVAVYDGSLNEWAADDSAELVTSA